ncbi:MAG: hypothetical protein AAB434_05260 [Planctomycetota bacterium]
MGTHSEVFRRLLASIPDVPAAVREEIVKAGEGDALLELFRRRAGEEVRAAEDHHRRIEALIRRS